METHVKVLGALNVACGLMGLFGAAILTVIFGGAATAVGASGNDDAAVAIPIIGLTGLALVICLIVLSLPEVIIGVGLFKMRQWARIGGIVVSLLSLFAIPFGTLLGIYGLWVLFSKDTERLFTSGGAPA